MLAHGLLLSRPLDLHLDFALSVVVPHPAVRQQTVFHNSQVQTSRGFHFLAIITRYSDDMCTQNAGSLLWQPCIYIVIFSLCLIAHSCPHQLKNGGAQAAAMITEITLFYRARAHPPSLSAMVCTPCFAGSSDASTVTHIYTAPMGGVKVRKQNSQLVSEWRHVAQ